MPALLEPRLTLADLCIEEKNAKEAERLALAAEEEFAREKVPESQALSAILVSRALTAQGNHLAAESAMTRARALMPEKASPPAKLSLDLALGRLLQASNKMAEARSRLEQVLSRAKKYGFKAYELEAQVELGRDRHKSRFSQCLYSKCGSFKPKRSKKSSGCWRVKHPQSWLLLGMALPGGSRGSS